MDKGSREYQRAWKVLQGQGQKVSCQRRQKIRDCPDTSEGRLQRGAERWSLAKKTGESGLLAERLKEDRLEACSGLDAPPPSLPHP